MKIALGTVQFGLDYGISNSSGSISLPEIKNILLTAKKANINILDTAQSYGNSETKIGLCDTKSFNIVTKIKPGTPVDLFEKSIENSGKLLNTKLYAVLYHDISDFLKDETGFEILRKAKTNKKIEKIGFSLYYPENLDYLFRKNIDFDIVQIPFSIFDQRFKPYFYELKSRNIEIHVRSVFLQGLVFMDPENLSGHFTKYKPQLHSFHDHVKRSEFSVQSICLHHACSQLEIDKVVIGVSSHEELQTNIEYIQKEEINNNLLKKFDDFKSVDENLILPFNWK